MSDHDLDQELREFLASPEVEKLMEGWVPPNQRADDPDMGNAHQPPNHRGPWTQLPNPYSPAEMVDVNMEVQDSMHMGFTQDRTGGWHLMLISPPIHCPDHGWEAEGMAWSLTPATLKDFIELLRDFGLNQGWIEL